MCQQEPNYPNFPKPTKRKALNCKIFESNSSCWFKRESSEMHRNTKASLLRCKVSLSVMWAGILPMSCSLYQCDRKFSTLQLESGRSCASPCSLAENALCSCSTAPRAAGPAPQCSPSSQHRNTKAGKGSFALSALQEGIQGWASPSLAPGQWGTAQEALPQPRQAQQECCLGCSQQSSS